MKKRQGGRDDQGHIEEFIIGLTEGLKVMLHKHDSQ